jgi:WD40 repeat protein
MRMSLHALLCILVSSQALAAPSYEEAVVPLLRSSCAGCHNDDEPESGFSVETFASVRRGGDAQGDPIVPGDPAASILLQRITSTGDDHMPPREHPQPTESEVRALEDWIAAGAAPPAVDHPLSMGLLVPTLPGFAGRKPVTAVAYSPDRLRVAVARGRSIELAPVGADGLPLHTDPSAVLSLHDLPGTVTAVHFSADGAQLVVAGGIPGLRGQAELRDTATGNVIRVFAGHRDLLYDAELSPDQKLLATAGYDGTIRIWQVADATLLQEIDVHNAAVFDLAWHPDGGVLASASGDETVKLWRAADGQRLDTLSQPQGEVRRVVFSPDGQRMIAAGRDKRIHIWQLVSLTEPAINPQLSARFAHESPITALEISADGGTLVTAAEDQSVTSWSLPALTVASIDTTQSDIVSAIAPWHDTRFLLGRMDGSLSIVDTASPAPATNIATTAVTSFHATERLAGSPIAHAEAEPNDTVAEAEHVDLPARVSGTISREGDADCFRFHALAGQRLLCEVDAARSKSQLDSRIELFHASGDAAGQPVPQVRLQAVRDSWFTFRGKDSSQSGDFRLHNWREMELDEFLYAGGEVSRLWLYPRGPDSGFLVYPGFGTRQTFFQTTAVTHALGEPAWIVKPLPPHTPAEANGLPVFDIPYENDDQPQGRLGRDSQMIVEIPADGDYVLRVRDTRGFGSPSKPNDFRYTLEIRSPQPTFRVAIGGTDTKVSPGSGRELSFTATRLEGFDGPIEITIENLPAGFTFHGPIQIEQGQLRAFGVLSAAADAVDPAEEADKAVRVIARAAPVAHTEHGTPPRDTAGSELPSAVELGTLGNLQLGPAPKVTVAITEPGSDASVVEASGQIPRFSIHPGETITARVVAERHDFTDRIAFGNEDSGRNLPYAVFVDNIGLNGLMIVEGQTEREFFMTASPVARPGQRLFHLRATGDGGQCSLPAIIEVLP